LSLRIRTSQIANPLDDCDILRKELQMARTKILFSVVLAVILLATQVIAAGAAPVNQGTTPITGTVVDIALEPDPETGVSTVLVTLDDGTGVTQTVRLSIEDASTLGLVVNGEPVDPTTIVDPIEIDPGLVIPDAPAEEAQHPVGSALSDFFSELLGVDYEMIMDAHEDGVGFGVIAQALWMTNALVADEEETEMTPEELFAAILEAKQNHDFSGITLPDGSEPQNWGQFRKALLKDPEKAKQNLGVIMSGHAEEGQGEQTQNQEEIQNQEQVQGNANNGNGVGNGNNDNGNGNGPTKDKNNGNNKDKDKDKGKGNPH
jgi:hypothetical protein